MRTSTTATPRTDDQKDHLKTHDAAEEGRTCFCRLWAPGCRSAQDAHQSALPSANPYVRRRRPQSKQIVCFSELALAAAGCCISSPLPLPGCPGGTCTSCCGSAGCTDGRARC